MPAVRRHRLAASPTALVRRQRLSAATASNSTASSAADRSSRRSGVGAHTPRSATTRGTATPTAPTATNAAAAAGTTTAAAGAGTAGAAAAAVALLMRWHGSSRHRLEGDDTTQSRCGEREDQRRERASNEADECRRSTKWWTAAAGCKEGRRARERKEGGVCVLRSARQDGEQQQQVAGGTSGRCRRQSIKRRGTTINNNKKDKAQYAMVHARKWPVWIAAYRLPSCCHLPVPPPAVWGYRFESLLAPGSGTRNSGGHVNTADRLSSSTAWQPTVVAAGQRWWGTSSGGCTCASSHRRAGPRNSPHATHLNAAPTRDKAHATMAHAVNHLAPVPSPSQQRVYDVDTSG